MSKPTPFQQGKAAFAAKKTRRHNSYSYHTERDAREEWNAGYDFAAREAVVQPEGNLYAQEVYAKLVVLAAAFRESQCYSVADELDAMAARGPDEWRGIERFSTPDLMRAASARLAEIARMAEREKR